MLHEELEAKVLRLEERLSNPEAFEERLAKVTGLEERCMVFKEDLTDANETIDTLQKDIRELHNYRDKVDARRWVLAGFGLTAAAVAGFVFYQLNQAEQRLSNTQAALAGTQATLNATQSTLTDIHRAATELQMSMATQLQPQIERAQTKLNDYLASGLDKRFPEVFQSALAKVAEINLLDVSVQQPFVKNLYHDTIPDPGVAKMTADGADFDWSRMYPTYPLPAKAKGLIVQVVIYATDQNKKNLAFLGADSKGAFGENRLTNFTNVATSAPSQ
jgi:uncharacterized membrane-anchored protein YhcB (DUF1043 family)